MRKRFIFGIIITSLVIGYSIGIRVGYSDPLSQNHLPQDRRDNFSTHLIRTMRNGAIGSFLTGGLSGAALYYYCRHYCCLAKNNKMVI